MMASTAVSAYKIMNTDDTPFAAEMSEQLNGIASVDHYSPSSPQLLDRIPEYDGYFCSLKVQLTGEMIDNAKKLKVIVTPSTGLDHIDVVSAANKGIDILSLKHEYGFLDQLTATAELSWGLLLSVVRKIPWAFAAAREGDWARDRYRGTQLSGKTLGILGYGRLGRMVARYGKAFRMNVIACDVKKINDDSIEQVDFPTLLSVSDVLSIHLHLTPETKGLIDKQAIAGMKDGAVLINTSRGAIVEEAGLLEGLRSGKVAAAGLDVIDGEWRDDLANHGLIQYARNHDNLLISPHIGGITHESNRLAYRHALHMLKDYLHNCKNGGRGYGSRVDAEIHGSP